MLPRYIREMRRCNINASHEIFVAILPFISLALRTLYRRAGAAAAGVVNGGPGRRRREDDERVAEDRLVELLRERLREKTRGAGGKEKEKIVTSVRSSIGSLGVP